MKINFKEARLKLGWTQAKAARMCRVSLNTWINWEKGIHPPREKNLRRIKAELGIKGEK